MGVRQPSSVMISSLIIASLFAVHSSAFIIGPVTQKTKGYTLECTDDSSAYERCVAVGREPITEDMVTDGDILISEEDKLLRNAIIDERKRWPNATVPYVFHKAFNKKKKEKILKALSILEEETCVRFVPWKGSGSYALITNEEGCHSSLGYVPNKKGYARVNLDPKGCLGRVGTIQHEFLHLLGLKHEHARPDRDSYIRVLWNNIKKGHMKNFEKASAASFTTFGLPYDYMSVMHYFKYEFSKNNKPTLEAIKNNKMDLGQRNGPTELDLEKIRRMYCKIKEDRYDEYDMYNYDYDW